MDQSLFVTFALEEEVISLPKESQRSVGPCSVSSQHTLTHTRWAGTKEVTQLFPALLFFFFLVTGLYHRINLLRIWLQSISKQTIQKVKWHSFLLQNQIYWIDIVIISISVNLLSPKSFNTYLTELCLCPRSQSALLSKLLHRHTHARVSLTGTSPPLVCLRSDDASAYVTRFRRNRPRSWQLFLRENDRKDGFQQEVTGAAAASGRVSKSFKPHWYFRAFWLDERLLPSAGLSLRRPAGYRLHASPSVSQVLQSLLAAG